MIWIPQRVHNGVIAAEKADNTSHTLPSAPHTLDILYFPSELFPVLALSLSFRESANLMTILHAKFY